MQKGIENTNSTVYFIKLFTLDWTGVVEIAEVVVLGVVAETV